jgi:hypothetical protein
MSDAGRSLVPGETHGASDAPYSGGGGGRKGKIGF